MHRLLSKFCEQTTVARATAAHCPSLGLLVQRMAYISIHASYAQCAMHEPYFSEYLCIQEDGRT
jgi:hypothetical protein